MDNAVFYLFIILGCVTIFGIPFAWALISRLRQHDDDENPLYQLKKRDDGTCVFEKLER